jgi:hypothetical protein
MAQWQRRAGMNHEEYLDRLIERRAYEEVHIPVANDKVAASLAAAEVLAQLQEIEVPPGFAHRLELSIRTRARSLAEQNGGTMSLERPLSLAEQNGGTMSLERPLSLAGSQRFLKRRAWIAVLRIAAVLMVACVGLLTVSAHSLPGDALYGLKQAEHQFTLTFENNPQNRVSAQIDLLRSALVDLGAVVNDGRSDDAIRLALDTVAAKTIACRGAVVAVPAGSEREVAQRDLDSILTEEEQTLRHQLDQVDWPIRLAFTQQLGTLGDPVPTVTHVAIRTQINGMLLITMTGSHFAPQAELIIDGRPAGMVSQTTPEQLVAVISNAAWSPGSYAVGVRNPDGTAAQKVLNVNDNNHSRQGTPESGKGSDE